MNTPWGLSDDRGETLAEGIVSYSTPSHGGIWLSPERQKELGYADNFLKNPAWWEEDCDWAVPFVFFADAIRAYGKVYKFQAKLEAAELTVKHYHPKFAADYLGHLAGEIRGETMKLPMTSSRI